MEYPLYVCPYFRFSVCPFDWSFSRRIYGAILLKKLPSPIFWKNVALGILGQKDPKWALNEVIKVPWKISVWYFSVFLHEVTATYGFKVDLNDFLRKSSLEVFSPKGSKMGSKLDFWNFMKNWRSDQNNFFVKDFNLRFLVSWNFSNYLHEIRAA